MRARTGGAGYTGRVDTVPPVLPELAAAALICLDPGHGTAPDVGRQLEPIGPGARQLKIKDAGGAAGEEPVALAIARRTRTLLIARGYRVAMTRDGVGYRGGNRERARFCNSRGAALMLRIHADGSADPSVHGVSTLVPALRRGWTSDIYAASRRAGRTIQRELVAATGARDLGVVERADLTGFNWADVPAVLVETGFMSNRREAGLLRSAAYQQKVAGALARAAQLFLIR
jgi:N-acetylmuramoyl-L-alanine amidase